MPDQSPITSARRGVIVLACCAAAALIAGILVALTGGGPWFVALGAAFAAVFLALAYLCARLVAVVGWLRATETPVPEFWDEESVARVLARVDAPEAPDVWTEDAVAQVLKRLGGDTRGIETRLRRSTARDVSALLALHALVPIEREIPSPGGWAATPQTLLALVTAVRSLPDDSLVVECGSGTSSVWLGLAAKQRDRGIRVVSIDHDAGYFTATQEALRRSDVADVVEVRLAPLESQDFDGTKYEWYAPGALADLDRVALLFVDGPPARSGKEARYPAFPFFRAKLVDGALVVLDDTTRKVESAIVERWLSPSDAPGELHHERDLDRSSLFRFSLSAAAPSGR